MSNRVTWFERAFNFDFPVGYFGDILERLEGGPVRVEAKVRGLASAALTKRVVSKYSNARKCLPCRALRLAVLTW